MTCKENNKTDFCNELSTIIIQEINYLKERTQRLNWVFSYYFDTQLSLIAFLTLQMQVHFKIILL